MRSAAGRPWITSWRIVPLLTLVVSVPLLVSLIALTRRHWYPVLDLAMTEFRVRDVGGRHTPLIGLPGRIGNFPEQGSHPGPLSFYLLAPTYRLLGSTSWALELGSVVIHVAAIAASLTLAYRRAGWRLCFAAAALLAVVIRGYGANVLTQPWNPYLPLLAWIVVLLAVWSVLEGDAPAVAAFVVAGTLCAQTHVPYLGLIGGLGGLGAIWLVIRRRVDRTAGPIPGLRRWVSIAGALGAVLWLPPIVDQVRHTPGNLSMLSDYFRHPPEPAIGVRRGVSVFLQHLDIFRVLKAAVLQSDYFKSTALTLPGPIWPGVLVLLGWLGTVTLAWRLGNRPLVHLHAVIAAALAVGLVATVRIFGVVWYYLTFWMWSVVTLGAFAALWTVWVWWRRRRTLPRRAPEWFAVALLSASGLAFTYSAAHLVPPENYLSAPLGRVAGPTARALAERDPQKKGVYVVTWEDVAYFGSQGYGLVDELERQGFDARATPTFHVPVTATRVIDQAQATLQVHFATGLYVDRWRARSDAIEVAFYDPRNDEQKQRYAAMRASVLSHLHDLGLDDLAAHLDSNLFGVQLDPRVPRSVNVIIDRMLQLGQPTAVFLAPATAI